MSERARHAAILGVQWGDEGKGKMVDVLTESFDVVVRFQGGANAGHTVRIGDEEFILHLIPSGILHPGKICAIGNGVVLDPRGILQELDDLEARGIRAEGRLWLSDRAHVVLPHHKALDRAAEASAGGGKIGTTLRGIGPCYADKVARSGIRLADLTDRDRFARRLAQVLEEKNRILRSIYGAREVPFDDVVEEYSAYGRRLRPMIRDVSSVLEAFDRQGLRILFEGAQGALLDIDMGTYPYVTSSNTGLGGIATGTGFSPRRIGHVWGVVKAYATRVGAGPFPTELRGESAEDLRERGHEFGATTGRPRRCGWLDLVALRHTLRVCDVDSIILTKVDVLDAFEEISYAVAYRTRDGETMEFPTILDDGKAIEPVYRTLPGWRRPTRDLRRYDELPPELREYIAAIADGAGRPVSIVSVGSERSECVRLDPPLGIREGA
ncbi:MAG: adenylosuccinate synthase [Planctomycetes bacterium]|nr:adenylosuccinate synthase [Planctomycetota bacterium]